MSRIIFKHLDEIKDSEMISENDLVINYETNDFFFYKNDKKIGINTTIRELLSSHSTNQRTVTHISNKPQPNTIFTQNDELCYIKDGVIKVIPSCDHIPNKSINMNDLSTDIKDILTKLSSYSQSEISDSLDAMETIVSELYLDMETRDASSRMTHNKFFEDGIHQFNSSVSHIDNTHTTISKANNLKYSDRLLISDDIDISNTKLVKVGDNYYNIIDKYNGIFNYDISGNINDMSSTINNMGFYYDYCKILPLIDRIDTVGIIKNNDDRYELTYFIDGVNKTILHEFESLPNKCVCSRNGEILSIVVITGNNIHIFKSNINNIAFTSNSIECGGDVFNFIKTLSINDVIYIFVDFQFGNDRRFLLYKIDEDIETVELPLLIQDPINTINMAIIDKNTFQLSILSDNSVDKFTIIDGVVSPLTGDVSLMNSNMISKSVNNIKIIDDIIYMNHRILLKNAIDYTEIIFLGGNEYKLIFKGILNNTNVLFTIDMITLEVSEIFTNDNKINVTYIDPLLLNVSIVCDNRNYVLFNKFDSNSHEITLNTNLTAIYPAGTSISRNKLNNENLFNLTAVDDSVILIDIKPCDVSNKLIIKMNLDKSIELQKCELYEVVNNTETKIIDIPKVKTISTSFTTKEITLLSNHNFEPHDYMLKLTLHNKGFIQNIIGTFI